MTDIPSNLAPEQMTANSCASSAAFTFLANAPASMPGRDISSYTYCSMALREVRDYTQHLCGHIKTIVDAAIADPKQNKAVKDLIHAAFWTEHYTAVKDWCDQHVSDLNAMDPMHPHGVCNHPFPFYSDKPLPLESLM